jgi:proline iminopeptidase
VQDDPDRPAANGGAVHVEVDGLRLFVDALSSEYVPDGPQMRRRRAVLFLHGGIAGDSAHSRGVASLLTDIAQVLVTDRRGNGRSEGGGDPSVWTLDRFADDVRELCVALGVEHPVVVGTSYGGLIAVNYAIRHPDHPSGLAVVSSGAHFDRGRSTAKGGPADAAAHGPELAAVSARTLRRRGVDAYPPQLLHGIDMRADLPAITCPTLCVTGDKDRVFPPDMADEVAAGVSATDVRVVRIPDAGHILDVEAPRLVAAELRTFVERIGPPPERWRTPRPRTEPVSPRRRPE